MLQKSRNFSLNEIVHRTDELPRETWAYISAGFLTGVAQMIRDILTAARKKQTPIKTISGYRSPAVNEATPGAAANSYHLWRLAENFEMVVGWDFQPLNPDLTPLSKEEMMECYNTLAAILWGEFYYDISQNKFHYSPYPHKKEHWIQP